MIGTVGWLDRSLNLARYIEPRRQAISERHIGSSLTEISSHVHFGIALAVGDQLQQDGALVT
jgi:hypothetical protein